MIANLEYRIIELKSELAVVKAERDRARCALKLARTHASEARAELKKLKA